MSYTAKPWQVEQQHGTERIRIRDDKGDVRGEFATLKDMAAHMAFLMQERESVPLPTLAIHSDDDSTVCRNAKELADRLRMEQASAEASGKRFYSIAMAEIIEPHLRALVLLCATICGNRARASQLVATRNEARKCADAIRHHLLAVQGKTEVCLRCDGHGCEHCEGRGVRWVKGNGDEN